MLAHKTGNVELTLKSLPFKFNINNLEFRTQFNDLRWLYNLLNSKINCPEICALININAPNLTLKFTFTFYVPICKRNYYLFSSVKRMGTLIKLRILTFSLIWYKHYRLELQILSKI
jgi:hypothetical protein